MIYETAPAKINLTLDTLYKRDDGYHEVEMIMTTIDLSDRLSFEKRNDSRIVLKVDETFIPSDDRNLAYRAALLMKETYQIKQGVTITLEKNIPVAAGLAGGSSDAAATMRGMNRLFELNRSLDELSELSAAIGSDVPFCVYGTTALCKGRGEILEILPKTPSAWVIVAKPQAGLSTPEIYGGLDLSQPFPVHTEQCLKAIEENDYDALCKSLSNRLEPVSMQLQPEIAKIKTNMLNNGADGALMSGSGPTVYGFAQRERQARHIFNAVSGCCNDVYLVRTLG
ncbi:4-(cytidine 5'-diphospho)-2-C-methyl-D-erythritol kinase [Staphylococcus pseudintermedius]|uniref:Putative 4-diphosphocytidyl-2-C-methyl-D-erythritol kinase n=2 Tax=Staphylococcus pseudintermedius TaxID=283734 RepID=A0A166RIX8_STAPS|nr:4-(cytidine 5'-diphospho)-2-C-methyl-D-erythritol kinase [Staphylococcus pseudintermedius]ADV04687.1 4-diphosphocytidyl-2-C-methyl-D-erythritol kinase [Staphylococcus pseudintermedius HKU10-03]ADX77535.1 4-diphosphocytidyl-2C-methyl-D-erythritol kinase [Staphylococcus pseudintermedius ED99]ANQ82851.1 4-(cytidine 5'-diphospho)-2-C-methyl-D-erythritol kinase [Staphylococcus pseudintermedius]ANQ89292.1 4-(cytidine 5'-diphospho)-2-C-methyl-D-erythritol kinase [Staphylococcus pseudintermedius]AN